MDIKKRLQNYSDMQMEYEQIKERIDSLNEQLSSIHSQSFDGVAACSGNGDKIGDMIATLSDLQTLYIKKSNELMKEMIEIERIIAGLEYMERVLIRKRYFECKPWEVVCVEMNYGYRGILKVHSRILQKLRKIA